MSSVEENSIRNAEALAEWRSSDQVENGSPSTSPPYWYTDEFGSKHSELYGKHTWKIEKYSEINKLELCSDVFDAGGYKWYILISPQVCDDGNYLSLYLCLANHEELRPGWSLLAQSTLALMNKDPKKSKFSDTLNRFWKRELNWGWNMFIKLPKLQQGYIDDLDSLIIKARVQVIRERVDRPLRCLSSQYRRELVRVHLPYVEHIFWQYTRDERFRFCRLIQDKEKWQSFSAFWLRLDKNTRRKMCREKMDVVLNLAAKLFFVLRQGTSTLVMDSLYSGWKAIEGQTKKMDNVRELPAGPAPIVSVDQDMFVLEDDLLLLIQRTLMAPPINLSKVGNVREEYNEEAIGRDESRLAEVGRRTMEMLVLAHIYSNKIDVAYQEHIAWIRQEQLIGEEEQEWLAGSKQKAIRGTSEKERKSKKKQAKQKKNKKEKRKEERLRSQTEEKDTEKEESVRAKTESSADTLGESNPVHCELDDSEIHHPPSGDTSSSISVRTGNVLNWQTKNRRRKGKTQPRKESGAATETEDQPSRHASNPKSQSLVISRIQEAHNSREHNPVRKDQMQEKSHAVFSPPKASPWNLPSVAQAKPEKKDAFSVDTVPNRKAISARSPLSDQASPPRDIQFQTMGSRAAVQNTTSPKPSISRPLRDPTFFPKQAASQTSSTDRVSSPIHSQANIPQSYKHAIVCSLSSDHSSSQSTGTRALPSCGLLRTGGQSFNIDTTAETISGNHRMNSYNTLVQTDEFPHLDIINDLLEEEHGLVETSGYRLPQWLNNVHSFTYPYLDLHSSNGNRGFVLDL